ncbi:hypothetical protein ABFT80_00770 [Mesorhizobium sp. SB112]|uniref:hypothetical protein n=1 Tax=Mesorhizobium sp. SB112 TaxID=3151853 RepID=UPI003265110A
MLPEIYLDNARHHFLVSCLTEALRKPEKRKGDHRNAVLAQIKLAGIDSDDPVFIDGVLTSARYAALIDVLIAHKPCPGSGEIEDYQVVNALGEFGNVWPDCVLEERELASAA